MFDILVYLFETYHQPAACPEPSVLARKLTAAGFDQADISAALGWLSGLERLAQDDSRPPGPGSLRLYCSAELTKLSVPCRGFLSFLENAGAIDAVLREMIIQSAMVLPERVVSLGTLKIIVLMVMWRRDEAIDTLLLEELLAEEDDLPYMH